MSEDFKEQKQHEIREKWAKYAKAKSEHAYLEHYRKSLMAILQKEYMASGHASVAAQEREARADVRYLEVLEGIKVSVEQDDIHPLNLSIGSLLIRKTGRSTQYAMVTSP